MKGFILALQFMTRLPMPNVETSSEDFARSMRWFPAVGIVVGGLVAGGAWAGSLLDPRLGAIAALAIWVLVTGGLHLDGLADLVDARGAAHGDKARFLEVLADPHIGSFGVMAIMLQMIAKFALLLMITDSAHWPAIVLIPFAARLGPLYWARQLPPLHPGLGSRFRNAVQRKHIAFWLLLVLVAGMLAPALWVTPLFIILLHHWFRTQLGGVSGDCHGAGIELGETVLLLAAVIIGGF